MSLRHGEGLAAAEELGPREVREWPRKGIRRIDDAYSGRRQRKRPSTERWQGHRAIVLEIAVVPHQVVRGRRHLRPPDSYLARLGRA